VTDHSNRPNARRRRGPRLVLSTLATSAMTIGRRSSPGIMGDRRSTRKVPPEGSPRDTHMPTIKQRLQSGQAVRLFGIGQLLSPKIIEIVGVHGGFDGLWLDAEHTGLDMKAIEIATLAAKAYGLDHFVRLPATDYASIMRPLEAGAGGVMVSMV